MSGLTAPNLAGPGPGDELQQPSHEVDIRPANVAEWLVDQATRAAAYSDALIKARETIPGVEWAHHHGRNLPVQDSYRAVPRGSHLLVDFEPPETDVFSNN